MDIRGFCTSARLFIVAGKGGVGKTTVTAALARMASLAGLSTLIIEVEGRSGLGAALGRGGALDYDEITLVPQGSPPGAGAVRARTITPDAALLEYLDEHGMRRISRRLIRSGAVDLVATAAPGIKDILVLGKVKQLERSPSAAGADLIVLDAPATGHAVTFLQSAHGLLAAARVGPIRSQARDVVELLTDPKRCQVLLVTLPEETPVNEVIETASALTDRVGTHLGPVIVNGMYPVLDGIGADVGESARLAEVELADTELRALTEAATFRRQRQELQAEQAARLTDALALPQLHLPYLFTEAIGPAEVDELARRLAAAVGELPALAEMR